MKIVGHHAAHGAADLLDTPYEIADCGSGEPELVSGSPDELALVSVYHGAQLFYRLASEKAFTCQWCGWAPAPDGGHALRKDPYVAAWR